MRRKFPSNLYILCECLSANLSQPYRLLSRAHSNYLAQINIRMNERQEQTADVLGKLTVLGTIVLPMNIVTGMWGKSHYTEQILCVQR